MSTNPSRDATTGLLTPHTSHFHTTETTHIVFLLVDLVPNSYATFFCLESDFGNQLVRSPESILYHAETTSSWTDIVCDVILNSENEETV